MYKKIFLLSLFIISNIITSSNSFEQQQNLRDQAYAQQSAENLCNNIRRMRTQLWHNTQNQNKSIQKLLNQIDAHKGLLNQIAATQDKKKELTICDRTTLAQFARNNKQSSKSPGEIDELFNRSRENNTNARSTIANATTRLIASMLQCVANMHRDLLQESNQQNMIIQELARTMQNDLNVLEQIKTLATTRPISTLRDQETQTSPITETTSNE